MRKSSLRAVKVLHHANARKTGAVVVFLWKDVGAGHIQAPVAAAAAAAASAACTSTVM